MNATLNKVALVQQVTHGRSVTADVCSVQEHAARITMLVMDGAKIPSMSRVRYRKWRDRHAQPSPLARLLASIDELPTMQVPRERAQVLVDVVQHRIDRAYGLRPARVTSADIAREVLAEHGENMASLPYVQGDRSPEACRAWANALRVENALQADMIRSLEAEAEGAR